MHIFQDESGCLGFNAGSSKHYVVTLLCTEESKHISNVIRKFKGHIIKVGWPRSIEIKAYHLFHADRDERIPNTYQYKNDPSKPIKRILRTLSACNIEVETIVIKKADINQGLKSLPPPILMNYFVGEILINCLAKCDNAYLFVDKSHAKDCDSDSFNGYIETKTYIQKGTNFHLDIQHVDSNVVKGVSAADFLCWSIFRRYESHDSRFIKLFAQKINVVKTLFF
ncbi:DUF3800 domain-containing protein [Chloroflexota bacterium]